MGYCGKLESEPSSLTREYMEKFRGTAKWEYWKKLGLVE